MAVIKITNEEKYDGFSTDLKPTDVEEGSTFHAVDTGEVFIFHNDMWEKDLRLVNAIK